MGRPAAAISGKYEGDGMWMACPPPASAPCSPACPSMATASPDPPAATGTTRPPSVSAYLRCHRSSSEWTTGISSKLYSGGGEEVAHSRVRASQGSASICLGLRKLAIALTRNTRTLIATTKAPIDETMFQKESPSDAG